MLHALTYSIISHLKTQIPEATEVVWMRDGVVLTDIVKPFLNVEQMSEISSVLSSGRTDFEETYRFQVGLFANSMSERSKLSDVVKSVLRQKNIPLLNTSVNPPTEAGVFICDVLNVTPMTNDDISNDTNNHRVYLDIEVTAYVRNGDGINFTQ